jgi:DUF438 domain-containing protein
MKQSDDGKTMIDGSFMLAILDSLKDPLLFADTGHTVRFMNRAAAAHYRGGRTLIGSSLLDCHNAASQRQMIEILEAMHNGEEERLISEKEDYRIYMRAVRDPEGRLVGYYERFEPRHAQ